MNGKVNQSAQVVLLAQALVGSLVVVTDRRGESQLIAGHTATINLKPGDKIVLEVVSDERWLQAQVWGGELQQELDKDKRIEGLAAAPGAFSSLPDDAEAARQAEIEKLHAEQAVDRATTTTTRRRKG